MNWKVTFSNSYSVTQLRLRDKTREEAEEAAANFGYVKPKWWQFWKKPAVFSQF